MLRKSCAGDQEEGKGASLSYEVQLSTLQSVYLASSSPTLLNGFTSEWLQFEQDSNLQIELLSMQSVLGVVYNPILDEMFVATRGHGAFLNGRPISVSSVNSLKSALFATEIGVSREEATMTAIFSRISALTQKVRFARLLAAGLRLRQIGCQSSQQNWVSSQYRVLHRVYNYRTLIYICRYKVYRIYSSANT